jgi:hypothetical protein
MLHWKQNQMLLGVQQRNLTGEANFEKTDILCLGMQCLGQYFPEDTTYAVSFSDTVLIHD